MATETKKDIFSKSYTEMTLEELNFVKARIINAKAMAEENSRGMSGAGKKKMKEICETYESKLREIRKAEGFIKQAANLKSEVEQQGPTN